MLNKKSFDKKSLNEAKEYFQKVHISKAQFKIFLDLIEVLLKHIKINEIAAKGIGWRAVREWQQKHSRDLKGIAKETHEERLYAITQILKEHVKPDLLEKLVDPKDENILNKTIEDILEFYNKNYSNL